MKALPKSIQFSNWAEKVIQAYKSMYKISIDKLNLNLTQPDSRLQNFVICLNSLDQLTSDFQPGVCGPSSGL